MQQSRRLDVLGWALSARSSAPRALKTLRSEVVVPTSLTDTFAFFADAANLQRITPPWLDFEIVTPMPLVMRAGVEIDYRIRLYGLPLPWRSRIDVWEPNVRFIDRQIVGPYRWWSHEHRFEASSEGTRVMDRVDYAPRAAWISSALVRRELQRIFVYRHEALCQLLARSAQLRSK
jgi:ligand-binding SRPBCC domain-containing protein